MIPIQDVVAGLPLVIELARVLIPAGGLNPTKFAAWWGENVKSPMPPDLADWAAEDARVQAELARGAI